MKIIDNNSAEYKDYMTWLTKIDDWVTQHNSIYTEDTDCIYALQEKIRPTEINEVVELLDKHNQDDRHILLIDDIDFDGTGACYIVFNYLRSGYKAHIDIHCNNKHGVTGEELSNIMSEFNYSFDLVIIVDSSTALIDTYISNEDLNCDILIMDHHELSDDFKKISYTGINNNTIVNCNSTRTNNLKCISAGMLSFIVMDEYYRKNILNKTEQNSIDDELGIEDIGEQIKPLNLFEIGAITNISDIVPVDDTVAGIVIDYLLHHGRETEFINKLIKSPTDKVDKYQLQWKIIPLINYTRRLADHSTINLLYYNNISASRSFLSKNHATGRNIVKQLQNAEIKSYNKFVYADISSKKLIIGNHISRFTGLFCNWLQGEYGKPSVVSVATDEGLKISVRSTGIDSLGYFLNNEMVEGGGHKSSCGFMIADPKNIDEVLNGYDNYLKSAPVDESIIIYERSISDLMGKYNMFDVGLYNELCFSNLKPMLFYIDSIKADDNIKIYASSSSEYMICESHNNITIKISIIKDEAKFDMNVPILLKPLYDPLLPEKFRLLAKNI